MQTGRPPLTEMAAAKFIESHGRSGLGILVERAERAEEAGHKVAARTWREMAEAAARLLGTELPRPAAGLGARRACGFRLPRAP